MMQKFTALFVLILLFLPCKSNSQNWMEKCSPSVRQLQRSAEIQDFHLVVRDLPSFLLRLQMLEREIKIIETYGPANIAVIQTRFSFLQNQILPLADVLYVDRGYAELREELPVPGHNLFANNIYALQERFPEWNGAERTVSIKENRFDTLDVDLWLRVAPVLTGSSTFSPHAALMATLAAGAGNSDVAGQGIAWGARLSASDFKNLLPDADLLYEVQEVSVQNHSYGVGIENYYGADAMAYDQSVAIRPSLLHVFSAGNLGDTSAILGSYAGLKGFANLSGSFKMAKNVLLVGALDSFTKVPSFSSRGPAYDGRIKPDLVAFGQDGSSGAAALVSGTAAVLQQAYAEQHQGALPTAALVRALLINGADDIGPPGPDFSSGFGKLNALRSVQMFDAGNYATAAIGNLDTFRLELDVPTGSRRFKITLAWDDPPALAGAPAALVHDLDMLLFSPDGQLTYLPYVLNSAPVLDSLQLPAERAVDSLNTVEQIDLLNPAPGTYRLEVRARTVGDNSQAFALAYHWLRSDTFNWISPARANPPLQGKSMVLYWDQSFDQAVGQLEYRYIDQPDWRLIDAAAPLVPGFYRWTTPDTFGLLQVRMVVNGKVFPSDTFLLAPELQLRIGFYCPDSVLLFWNTVAAPQPSYQLWGLGSRYLEPLLVTSDTFAVLKRSSFPQTRMAVSPLILPGVLGKRSAALDVSQQGLECYFKNILAAKDGEQRVQVQLELGSTHGLQTVSLEKWRSGIGFVPLETWIPPFAGEVFETLDSALIPGVNYYRAKLLDLAGLELLSDTVAVYSGGPSGFWVYPNPASGHEILQIAVQAPSEELEFNLFDVFGRLLLEKTLEAEIETVPLPALPPGIYPYAVRQKGVWVYSGKLLVDLR